MYSHRVIKSAFLILRKKKKVLLYRRGSTGYFDGFFSVISGNVEKNETFEEAIIREAKEEIGIEVNNSNLKVVHTLHLLKKDDESINVFFVSDSWEGEIKNLEPNKCSGLAWNQVDCLPNNMIPYVGSAIKDYFFHNKNFNESRWQ